MRDTDQVIDEFFEHNARAEDLRRMRDALEERLRALHLERAEGLADDEMRLTAKINVMERQIDALRTEEAVSKFVEDSIKVTLARTDPEDELE